LTDLAAEHVDLSMTQFPGSELHPWWKTGPIYQIFPRSFCDTNGDGVGDIRGIIDKLDYLNDGTDRSLRVKGIWLSPIYLSPGRDAGYDVADYEVIDPKFGNMDDFDALVSECQHRGIHIVMDMVLNHTSDLHRWFLESRSSRDHPRRDWYIWRNPGRGGRPPNNWRSFFGGSAWTFDEDTQQYFLHTFLSEQPDLNWQNPEVRAACLDVFRFWLERGVSGFRLDVFNAYFKHPDLLDNPWRLGTTPWTRQRQLNNKDRPELHDFLGELRSLLDEYPETMAVGETFDAEPELAASYCKQLHLAFDFDFLQQPWKPSSFQRTIGKWDKLLDAQDSWPCYVLSNHDNPRHAGRYSRGVSASEADARAKIAAALLLTLRGTPFIYSGEEIGLHDVPIPVHEEWDVAFKGSSRDPSRTPMQWNTTTHAGFSSGHPWLRVGPDYLVRNVAVQEGDPRSILTFYRRLVTLRNETPALLFGDWQPLQNSPDEALVYLREYEGTYAVVALNFTNSRKRVKLDKRLPARYWNAQLSTRRPDVGWAVRLDQTLELGPYEATIFTASDKVSRE
jgi:alpha-glucosidase